MYHFLWLWYGTAGNRTRDRPVSKWTNDLHLSHRGFISIFTIFNTRLEVRNANGAFNIVAFVIFFLFHLKLTLCKIAIKFLSPGTTEPLIPWFRLYTPNETCKKKTYSTPAATSEQKFYSCFKLLNHTRNHILLSCIW